MALEIKENEPLSNHCTFRIGGLAKYFVVAKNVEEIREAIDFAEEKQLPFFVLGGGSNILFKDKGYGGVVIKISNLKSQISNQNIAVNAGAPFALLINKSVEAGLTGLEWGIGIPGTVGGGVAGNCGAYGNSMGEKIKEVTVLTEDGEIKKYTKAECCFNYRTSKFKNSGSKEIILEIEFELARGNKEESQKKIKEILEARRGKVPTQPSAGSVFTNLLAKEVDTTKIPPEKIKGGKVPVGYLIEECGLRGKQIGGAQVSFMHANFIVNTGGAKASDVIGLINLCKTEVKNKFGIELEEEIVLV